MKRVLSGLRECIVPGVDVLCNMVPDDRLKAREAATDRRADKRAADMANQRAAMEERMAERKQKESATMDM